MFRKGRSASTRIGNKVSSFVLIVLAGTIHRVQNLAHTIHLSDLKKNSNDFLKDFLSKENKLTWWWKKNEKEKTTEHIQLYKQVELPPEFQKLVDERLNIIKNEELEEKMKIYEMWKGYRAVKKSKKYKHILFLIFLLIILGFFRD